MGLRRSFKPTNLVQNGDFSKGTTGWLPLRATATAANNVITVQGDGTNNLPLIRPVTPFINNVTNSKIYISMKVRVTNSDSTKISLMVEGSGGGFEILKQQDIPVKDTWYLLNSVWTISSAILGNIIISIGNSYASASTAKDKIMEVKELLAIDLNALFGAGNEPDKAWCALNIPVWFDGTLGGGVMNGTGGLK